MRAPLLLCRPDLEFINLRIDKTAIARLEEVANTPFKRLSYTDAIQHLEDAVKGGQKFEFPVRILAADQLSNTAL